MNRYYVAVGSERTGPYAIDELRALPLARGMLVWAQGMTDWVPAERVPDLLPLLPALAPASPAEPHLPRMAQLICTYASFVNPLMWLVTNLSCLAQRPWSNAAPREAALTFLQLVVSVVTLVTAVLLVVGAVQLRAARAVGATILRGALWVNVALAVVSVVSGVAIAIASPQGSGPGPAQPPSAGDVFRLLLTVYALAALAWEVVALVWLIRHRHRLPA